MAGWYNQECLHEALGYRSQAEYEAALTGTSHPASQPTPALAPTRNKAWDSSGGHRGHREDRFGGECGADRVVLVLLDRAGSSAVVGAVVGPG